MKTNNPKIEVTDDYDRSPETERVVRRVASYVYRYSPRFT